MEEELRKHKSLIEEWRSKYISIESRGSQIIEKRIEVPVEVVRVDNRRVSELEDELRRVRIQIEEWRSKYISLESRGAQIIEKRVEVPIEVVRYDDRRIKELEITISELRIKEQRLIEYENKLALMGSEIERLNYKLRKFESENTDLRSSQINNVTIIEGENRKLIERVRELENKLVMIVSENERYFNNFINFSFLD